MWKWLLLPLFFIASAHAAPRMIEEVPFQNLTLMGSPLKSAATEEHLSLSCLEGSAQNCLSYRFVLSRGKTHFYIGPVLTAPLAETNALLKSQIRKVYLIDFIEMPLVRKILSLTASLKEADEMMNANHASQYIQMEHYKFYYFKFAIEALDQDVKSWDYRKTFLTLTPAKEGQCKAYLVGTHLHMRGEGLQIGERIILLQQLMTAKELADAQGCVLTENLSEATYEVALHHVLIRGGIRSDYTFRELQSQKIITTHYTLSKGWNNVKADQRSAQVLSE